MNGPEEKPPCIADAHLAVREAETLADLIAAAAANPNRVMGEDTIPCAGYMILERLWIARAFIEAKVKEEHGEPPRAVAG